MRLPFVMRYTRRLRLLSFLTHVATVTACALGMSTAEAQGSGQNCTSSPTAIDSVAVDSSRTVPAHSVHVFLTGARPTSPIDIDGVTYVVAGSQVDVTAKMQDQRGFAVGGSYCYQFLVDPGQPGTYSVRYFIASGDGSGGYLPPRLVAITSFELLDAASPIPTIGSWGLVTLVSLILVSLALSNRNAARRAKVGKVLLLLAIGVSGAYGYSDSAEGASGEPPSKLALLLVVFDPRSASPSMEVIQDAVNTPKGQQANRALYERLARPLIAQRLLLRPQSLLESEVAKSNPVAPEAVLANYVILGYAPERDITAIERQFAADPQILAYSRDVASQFSVVPVDPYFSPATGSTPSSQFQWGPRTPGASAAGLNFPVAWNKVDDYALFPGGGTGGADCSATTDGYAGGYYSVPTDSSNWLGWVYPVQSARAICAHGISCQALGALTAILNDD